MTTALDSVWVFVSGNAPCPFGVFPTQKSAEHWIMEYGLEGTLTKMPFGIPIYKWAIDQGVFAPNKPWHDSPGFIAQFSCAALEHYHYRDGVRL